MTEVMKMTKKVVTSAVVATTIAWSVSLSAFLAPLTAKAAVTPGTLVKASLPAVYYVGTDMKRYVFPNEKTYKTWYADFSTVVTITDAELASLMIGGNVTYKPGVMMVKITTDPKVYAVDAHGVLRPIASEAVAAALYGANWNTKIHDVPDAFFTNYTVGAAINAAGDFNPAAATAAATSINVDKNLGSGVSAAGLSVSRASDSPMGATLPLGATGVNFLKVNVTNNGSAAAVLSSATFHRSGVGAASDFAAVYLYKGADRVTTGRTVNSSSNTVTFSGLNLSVAAGSTVSLWLAADICTTVLATCSANAGVGNTNSFSLTELLVGTNNVAGTPVVGSSFQIAGANVGRVEVEEAADPSNVKAGAKGAKVAAFTLQASGDEDLDIRSIGLTQDGDVNRSDLTNLVLKQAGLTLATTPGLNDKDMAVFSLSSPMFLEEGATRTFEVFADINGATRTDDDISFFVDENSDINATGRTYGHGVLVDNLWESGDQSVDIDAGNFTIAFNGPASADIAQGGSDIEIFNVSLSAAANVEVRNLRFEIACDDGAGQDNFDDFRLIDTASGALVGGPRDLVDCGDDMVFNETFNISAGQTRTLKLTVDVDDVAGDGDVITASLDTFGSNDVRNLDSGRYLVPADDMVPNSLIGGNQMTIVEPYLEIDAASTPVAQTYIKGSQNVALGAWSFQASDAAAITINSLDIEANGSLAGNTLVQTVKLWNGSTQVGNTETLDSSDEVTFDGLSITVPAGQTVTLNLTGNLGTSFSGSQWIEFGLFDVDATEPDGNNTIVNGLTAWANQMDIEDSGEVTVVLAPSDTESEAGIVVGGASNAVLAKYKFTAANEPLKVVKLRFGVADSGVGVTQLALYDGATLVGTASVNGSGEAQFSGMSVAIAKDASKTLTVKGNMSTVGASGADTGTDVTVTLLDEEFEVRGTSAGSSTLIDETSLVLDIDGYEKILRKTKPTVALSSLSGVLADGTMAVIRFTVTADTAGDVSFQAAEFTFNPGGSTAVSCTAATDSYVRKVGDGTNIAGECTDNTNSFYVEFNEEQVIAAGSSKTYDLRADISGVTGGDDSLSTVLESDNFTWSDNSVVAHDSTTMGSADWIVGGEYVKVLPTDSWTLQD